MLSHWEDGKAVHRSANACLCPLYAVEGMHVITVEGTCVSRSPAPPPMPQDPSASHGPTWPTHHFLLLVFMRVPTPPLLCRHWQCAPGPAPSSGGTLQEPRLAVWVLHARLRHEHVRAAQVSAGQWRQAVVFTKRGNFPFLRLPIHPTGVLHCPSLPLLLPISHDGGLMPCPVGRAKQLPLRRRWRMRWAATCGECGCASSSQPPALPGDGCAGRQPMGR